MSAFSTFPGDGPFWDDGSAEARVKAALPDAVDEVIEFRGERTLVVKAARVFDVLAHLRDDDACPFDMLTDVTAVHWPDRGRPFEVAWLLYSLPGNRRLRVKVRVGEDEPVPSGVPLWPAAGWLERECYDMFGIRFEGHPDHRRILMPDDFEGWPLRKDFPLKC